MPASITHIPARFIKPMDPRDRYGSDAPIVSLPVITAADAERARSDEEQLAKALDFHTVYDLIKRRGPDQVLQWVKDAVILQYGPIADSLPEVS